MSSNDGEPRLSSEIEAQLVRQANETLRKLYIVIRHVWPGAASEQLQRLHRDEGVAIARYLMREVGFAKSVLNFWRKSESAFTEDGILLELALIANLMAMISQLYCAYQQALNEPARKIARAAARRLLQLAVVTYCDGAEGQVKGLRVLCDRAVQIADGAKRVILLELPIGNSIPVNLLQFVLTETGHRVEVVTIARSRSDRKRKGVTREQLIDEGLSRLRLGDGDLLLLADEWNTGANFAKVTKYVVRALRKVDGQQARFVPIALLAPGARENASPSHIRSHDELASAAGVSGELCRIDFPDVELHTLEPLPFFWAERDRFAGYRKMQLFGSLMSNIDNAIERLAIDEPARKRAYLYALRAGDPLPAGRQLLAELERQFERGLLEYRARRNVVFAIDHPSNASRPEDIEAAYTEIVDLLEDTLGRGSDAAKCVAIASAFERHEGGIDPVNRFMFEEHVPVVWPLEGDERVLHEELIAVLRRRMVHFRRS